MNQKKRPLDQQGEGRRPAGSMCTYQIQAPCRKGPGAEDTPKRSQHLALIVKKADGTLAAPGAMWPVD